MCGCRSAAAAGITNLYVVVEKVSLFSYCSFVRPSICSDFGRRRARSFRRLPTIFPAHRGDVRSFGLGSGKCINQCPNRMPRRRFNCNSRLHYNGGVVNMKAELSIYLESNWTISMMHYTTGHNNVSVRSAQTLIKVRGTSKTVVFRTCQELCTRTYDIVTAYNKLKLMYHSVN